MAVFANTFPPSNEILHYFNGPILMEMSDRNYPKGL